MTTENGFVKVPNDLHKWEWFSCEKTLQIYMFLRLEARYTDGYYHGQKMERGQVLVKREDLEKKFNLSKQQLRTIINRLKSTHKITHEKVLNQSLFTLLDYDCSEETTHDLTDEQHTDNTRATHALSTKKEKKDKKEERDINTEVRNIKKEIKKYSASEIVELFNSICVSLPKVRQMTTTRQTAIKGANKTLSGDFESFFKKVEQSDFLTGRCGTWDKCCFDWILKPSNLVKILEGNYDNKRSGDTTKDYGENGIQTWT